MAELNTRMIGDAGEYYVAFKLAKMGIMPAMVSKGSKSVDIIGTFNGSRSVSIQVKTTAWQKPSMRWYVGREGPEPSESFYFLFVNIWRPGTPEFSRCPPEVYVVPSQDVLTATCNTKRPRFRLTKQTAKLYRENWNPIKKYLGVD